MTRADLARAVHERHGGITQDEALAVVDSILDCIVRAVVEDGKVLVSGFGSFRVQERKERQGFNPRTGRPMTISRRRTVSFRPSSLVRDEINRTP